MTDAGRDAAPGWYNRSMRGVLIAALTLVSTTTADVLSPKLADAFEKKVVLVQDRADQKAAKDRPTSFTQSETNSYLKFKAGDLLPTGLTQPEITMDVPAANMNGVCVEPPP